MAEQIKFGDRLFLKGEKLVLDNGASSGIIMSENGTVQIEGATIITGDLTVQGTTTTVNSATLSVDDKNLELGSVGTPTDTTADGGGITLKGTTDKTILWTDSTDTWDFSEKVKSANGFEGDLTGDVTGNLTGNVTGDITSSGSTFSNIDINGGTIDGTPIGATTPAVGNFSTITGDGTALTNILTNYDTDNLTEGSTNLFFTNERVDDRVDALFTSAYGITGTYNDAGDEFTIAFDPINAGSAIAVLDTTDTTQAKFRTIREGQIASGGHGDLTVALSGDEIVIDTSSPINELTYHTFTGNGSTSTYTLPYTIGQNYQILVYIDGVVKHPTTDYSMSSTTLSLTSPLGNGAVMNVLKLGTTFTATSLTDANTLGGNLPAHFLDWAQFTGTPTTISGYGITDAYTKTEVDNALATQDNTDEIPEGSTNLYYTNARADARVTAGFTAKSTTNLSEGTNLYYTDARSRAAISVTGDLTYNSSTGVISTQGLASSTTDDLAEGSTNLYYTNARADARAQLKIDALVDSAPGTLDTLNELAAALGDDANFSTTITNQIAAMSPTGTIIPSLDNTYDLGSTAKKYANIYGHSVHAHYADLAERYASDVPYESGTVVVFGGEAEITTTAEARDVAVAGVISTNPALKLNADAGNSQTHPYVALRGRVPCKMIGPVSKGDLIVTTDNEPGYAQSVGKENAGRSVFAKSIETDLTEGKRLIEVVIL